MTCNWANLHQNAEIALGTVHDLYTAKRWLTGTFLYVRLAQNPDHYKLDTNLSASTLDDKVEQICKRDIELLQQTGLLTFGSRLKCTEEGEAMARYCVMFNSMKVILSLPPKAKISELVSHFRLLSLVPLNAY